MDPVAWLGVGRRPLKSGGGERPLVSVVIPCRNEAGFIGACLDSILSGDYPRHRMEVIVADGMSRDGTREMVARYALRDARVRMVDNPERITPVALNRAIAATRGEIIVRFDAHAAMPRDYISKCVGLLEGSGADNVGGVMRTVVRSDAGRDAGVFAGPIVAALSHPFGVGNSAFRTGGVGRFVDGRMAVEVDTVFGGCWRREVFTRIGGFNERLARGQDLEFNLRLRRAGGRILLDPRIICEYYARTSFGVFWSHNFTNGVWAVLPFAWSNGVPVRWRHLAPLALVVTMGLALCAMLIAGRAWPAWIGLGYGAANLGASVRVAFSRRGEPRSSGLGLASDLVLMPITFAALHLAYGLGSLWGCFRLVAQLGRRVLARLRREWSNRSLTVTAR